MLTLGSFVRNRRPQPSALGTRVGFQSLIGDDSLGQIALDRLAESASTSPTSAGSQSTPPVAHVILHHPGWRIFLLRWNIAELSLKHLDFDYLRTRVIFISHRSICSRLRPDLPNCSGVSRRRSDYLARPTTIRDSLRLARVEILILDEIFWQRSGRWVGAR